MVSLFIETFWFFLPAGFANMAPVLFRCIPILDCPVDFGCSLGKQRIFGNHKTWRGVVFGVLAALIVATIQAQPTLIGLALGGGAIIGDLIKSFFKRRFGVPPGRPLWGFDQLDWIVGAYVASGILAPLSWQVFFAAIVLFGSLHIVVNLIGFWFGIKENKF